MKTTLKKGVMSEIIGVFILVLVISVLAGMTFLFTASLKSQVLTTVGAANGGANSTAYKAVNDTEASGATIINYLPLLFLAIIFGAILAVVLKIILPYINLGNQVSGF